MNIKVTYRSIDGCRVARTFKTLAGAQKFADLYVGATPELGSNYAVSGDGVGKIMVEGAKLLDLFPALQEPPEPLGGPFGDGRATYDEDGCRIFNSKEDDADLLAYQAQIAARFREHDAEECPY